MKKKSRKSEEIKNILVISHNSFNDINNMGQTLSRLFKYYPKRNISQLYFHSDPCDKTICDNYFRITDKDLLNTIIKIKKKKNKGIKKNLNLNNNKFINR